MRVSPVCVVALAGVLSVSCTSNPIQRIYKTARTPDVRREFDGTFSVSACPNLPPGVHCHARLRSDEKGNVIRADGREGLGTTVWGADDLANAYGVPINNSNNTTIAVLSMGDYTNAESDLATYRSAYGLPACGSANGCFTKINRDGNTSPLPDQASGDDKTELMLDLDMVSAGCPDCKIILAEADADWAGGDTAIANAVQLGAKVVTISYGFGAEPTNTADDSWNVFPGVSVFVSSGDDGYDGTDGIYPSTSPHVTAVGGTVLTRDATTARGWTETGWTSTDGGRDEAAAVCSGVFATPSWQANTNTGCSMRATADVSAVAFGVAMYEGGWFSISGTSVSTPLVAGIYAEMQLAGNGPAYSYQSPSLFRDITSGAGGSTDGVANPTTGVRATCGGTAICTVGTGWDGPTGNGSPDGKAMAPSYWASVPQVTSLSPTSGPASGGTSVVINGSGFTAGLVVSFGGVPSSSVSCASSTRCTAIAPHVASPGPVEVAVMRPGGATGRLYPPDDTFTYTPLPSLSLALPVVMSRHSITGTVSFSQAPSVDSVTVTSSNLGAATVQPQDVVINGTSGTFTVTALDVTAPTLVTIQANYLGGISTIELEVLPWSPLAVYFANGAVASGRSIQGEVLLGTAPTSATTVNVTTSSVLAAIEPSASVTISAGSASAVFLLGTSSTTISRSVTVTATCALGTACSGDSSSAEVYIEGATNNCCPGGCASGRVCNSACQCVVPHV